MKNWIRHWKSIPVEREEGENKFLICLDKIRPRLPKGVRLRAFLSKTYRFEKELREDLDSEDDFQDLDDPIGAENNQKPDYR